MSVVPGVSVVIPLWNCERFVGEAIESVLRQTLPPLEVVVVDDASTDSGVDIARAFGSPVVVLEKPHEGIGPTRNHGVERSRGSLLAFLDADDTWTPRKLELQCAALERDEELAMVFGMVRQFVDPGVRDDPAVRALEIPEDPQVGHHAGAMLVRREAFERVGPFDAEVMIGDFLHWYARAADLGLRGRVLTDVVMRRRIHDRNTVTRLREERSQYARVLKQVLDRRRADARRRPPETDA